MAEEELSLEERIKVSLNFFSALVLFLFIFIIPVFLIFMPQFADKYKFVQEAKIPGFLSLIFGTVNFLNNNYFCTFPFLIIIIAFIIFIQASRKNIIPRIKNYIEVRGINYPNIKFINIITICLFLLISLVAFLILLLPIIQLISLVK